jgi:hypothetical protein
MPEDVASWLEKLGLGQYARVFADNDIEWNHLPDLDVQLALSASMMTAQGLHPRRPRKPTPGHMNYVNTWTIRPSSCR